MTAEALDLEAIRARLAEVGKTARAHLNAGRSSMPIYIEDATLLPVLLAEVERLRTDLAGCQRAAETMGRVVTRNGEDICRIAGVPMPEDGDADYALAWERAFDMAARAGVLDGAS